MFTDHFTFGFELEGRFDDALDVPSDYDSWKTDGSVHMDNDTFTNPKKTNSGYVASEYASPIFQTFGEMIETLKKFEAPLYEGNSSCGLHLHIKHKDDLGLSFRQAIASSTFMKEFNHAVFDGAKSRKINKIPFLDSYQVQRLRGESKRWCEPYPEDLEGALHEWNRQVKYRVVRNHPHGTLEFRLLSPLGDRVSRVWNLMELVGSILEKMPDLGVTETVDFVKEKENTVLSDSFCRTKEVVLEFKFSKGQSSNSFNLIHNGKENLIILGKKIEAMQTKRTALRTRHSETSDHSEREFIEREFQSLGQKLSELESDRRRISNYIRGLEDELSETGGLTYVVREKAKEERVFSNLDTDTLIQMRGSMNSRGYASILRNNNPIIFSEGADF